MNALELGFLNFFAYNANAFAHLVYAFSRNYVVIILVACAIITIGIRLKEVALDNPVNKHRSV